jgi:Trypsin
MSRTKGARWVVGLGAAALVVSGAPACSQAPSADARSLRLGRAASAVQGGQVDAAHAFAVGVCGLASGPGQCGLVCSGTLLAPNLVLTARHCVDAPSSNADCATATWVGPRYTSPDQYWVTTSKDLYQATAGWHRVAAIRTPTDTALCGGDLALLVLQDVVAPTEAKPADAAVAYPLSDHTRYGLTETAIGYGITSPGTNTEGTRHTRTGIAIQCIPGDAQIGCDPQLAFAGNEKEFLAGDGTCDGDSGSGAFDQASFDAGAFVVLGALSRGGVSNDGLTCIGAVYTRLDVWRDFLVGGAAEAAKSGGYPAPAWTIAPSAGDAGAADADAGGGDGGVSNGPGAASHGCAAGQHYSSVPWQNFALGLLLWGLRRWNCTTKRTQFRRAVGKKTGYC